MASGRYFPSIAEITRYWNDYLPDPTARTNPLAVPKAAGPRIDLLLASNPIASLIRFAARPVGAHSASLILFAASMRRMALTMVVLPTPGLPVITSTLDISASRIAVI
jgi:hypothetical protein